MYFQPFFSQMEKVGPPAYRPSRSRQIGRRGKRHLSRAGQSVEGFEFTVLLGGAWGRVLDELSHQGEDEAIVGYKFGLQNGMVVRSAPIARCCQAIGAVAFGEAVNAGAINADQEISTAQAIAVEHFLSDQGFDSSGDHLLHFRDIQTLVVLVNGVSVGAGAGGEEGLKLGRGGSVVAQHQVDLPARSEAEQEHQHPCHKHGWQRIGAIG